MKIIYTKSKWEMWDDKLTDFIERVIKDEFDGTELYFDSVNESPSEIKRMHEDNNLFLLGQILSQGDNLREHTESFKRQADIALKAGSKLINVHAGKDYFSFSDNVKLIKEIISFKDETGIDFLVETHRGRATYSAIETRKLIEELPDIRLTADFSHWMVVHESDLSNQKENLNKAIERSYHIHARIGYEEGPQVTDPGAPEWEGHLNNHLDIWNKILEKRKAEGMELFTITPEFGPPNYMHTLPFTNEAVRDTWDMNIKMRSILQKRLSI